MAFAGLRGTGDFGADERPKNFREYILWRDPNGQAPLTALLAKMKSESTDDAEFSWWEEELNVVRLKIASPGNSATSTATVLSAGGLQLVAGDQLLVEKTETGTYDNEIVLVSSVTDDTNIVIKRAQSGSTGADIPIGAFVTKIGNVFGEGTNAPDVTNNNPTKLKNYCQIFKTAYELTETTRKTSVRTGDVEKNDKKRKMFAHSRDLEFAFLFGRAFEDTGANGKPRRWTGGLRSFISTNVTVFSTTPTEDTLLNAVYPVFDFNAGGAGDERIVFAGNGALNSLNRLARNSSSTRINFDGQLKGSYGMNLTSWILPQGRLLVRTHPLMNVHGRFSNSMFVVNPSSIIYRYVRDTMAKDNIQANDADTKKGQWLSECGLEVQHEKTMAYIGNFLV